MNFEISIKIHTIVPRNDTLKTVFDTNFHDYVLKVAVAPQYAAVEENEAFLDEMQECVEWGSPVILYCNSGGVIGDPELNFADGAQTASLIAAHELATRGWGTENIKHMAGGLGMWEGIENFDCGEVPREDR